MSWLHDLVGDMLRPRPRWGQGILAILAGTGIFGILLWHNYDVKRSAEQRRAEEAAAPLMAGFAEVDITPKVEGKPIYVAGFSRGRRASGVHDPLMARAVVLRKGSKKVALVSVDLVGFFHANVVNVRKQLPGFHYVLVSSTHNHEGPDTLGLWGPTLPIPATGIDPDYLKFVEEQVAKSVREAEKAARECSVRIGTAQAPELLHDNREPYIKHDQLVLLQFLETPTGHAGQEDRRQAAEAKPLGLLVQWNCHPETLGSKNTLISADFVGYTVEYLKKKHQCPVAYFTGTVGGLMTSLEVPIKDEQGKPLADGTFEKTERYGVLLGKLADEALTSAKPINLLPLEVRSRAVYVPMENPRYKLARQLGILNRAAFVWTEDPFRSPRKATEADETDKPLCIDTEVAILRFGELEIVAVPGEVYPELVLDKAQDPPDAGADFPDAPIEPAIYKQLKGPHRMIIGLANDEIGYILPKRQWDEKPPFCYGRKKPQYGEENSVGPEAGPILCRAIKELAEGR